jgi:GcrA cell cycle regulator
MNAENDSPETHSPGPEGQQRDMRPSVVAATRRCATSPWTDERIELVRALWSQGASAQRIARELGDDISRSAVLGKIHRLGIEQTSPNSGARRADTRNARLPAKSEPAATGRLPGSGREVPAWVRDAEPYVDNPLLDADIPAAQRRAFLDLSGRACRWPVGDPSLSDFFFCGAEALLGKPYCVAHCARAYRPDEEATRPERAPSSSRDRTSRRRHGRHTRRNRRRRVMDYRWT